MSTPLFTPVSCLMTVGTDNELADACAQAVPGLQVLRVGHAAAAVERMVVTRPLVVVLDASLGKADVERIVECARDIRAEVVHDTGAFGARLAENLRAAALAAEKAREADVKPDVEK